MTPDDRQPERAKSRAARVVAESAVAAAVFGGAIGLVAWGIARVPADPQITPVLRFVAFAFAAMGLALLAGPFLIGRFDWSGLFRWATVIDAAGVAVVVGSVVSAAVTWRQGLMLYAILASFALFQLAAMWVAAQVSNLWAGHRLETRATPRLKTCATAASGGAAAITGVVLAAVACSSLVWGHLPERLTRPASSADAAVLWVVRNVNPLLAANDAINPPTTFDWPHHGSWMYDNSIIGNTLGLPSWPTACGLYLAAAAVLAGLARWLPARRDPPD